MELACLLCGTLILVVRGNFKYEGLIIVTGAKVGFGMIGGGNYQQDVYGSIMINETSTDGSSYKELVLEGNAAVKRSQSALAYAKQLIPVTGISTIISDLSPPQCSRYLGSK